MSDNTHKMEAEFFSVVQDMTQVVVARNHNFLATYEYEKKQLTLFEIGSAQSLGSMTLDSP